MTHHNLRRQRVRRTDGAALYTVIVATVVFVGMTSAMITVSTANTREQQSALAWQQRRYLAETGIADAVVDLSAWNTGNIGSPDALHDFGAGGYHVAATDNANGTITLRSTGVVGGSERVLEAVVRDVLAGPFTHSIFAANSSEDPTYVLDFGGTGGQADLLTGDMYSGGDLSLSGDATATGNLRASGSVLGAPGESGVTIAMPDIAGANYPLNHDVNVAQEFASSGVWASNASYGGSAYQLPEANLAHIFRKNPNDRNAQILATTKDDYFLEDVYENVRSANTTNPSAATHITLAGVGAEPGDVSGNRKVYYVDGNIWIHNRYIYSIALGHDLPGGVQITFVARGNVYFADNLLINNRDDDGIAFIAIRDPNVPDSGNIYFGDPAFGTLMQMDAYMYAEEDFHDNNLDASGSSRITVNGTMSAGDQIAIDRDYDGTRHTKLVMNFDDRLDRGLITMPGVPRITTTGRRAIEVLSVYEVGAR